MLNTCYLLLLLLQLAIATDFYKVLDISRDASEAEIKRAYRKQSLLFHPDKNPGDEEAASKFAEIARANEVLSD